MKIKNQKLKQIAIKRKLQFEDYKKFLEVTQLENKTNNLEENKIDVKIFIS